MFEIKQAETTRKPEMYGTLNEQLKHLLEGERDVMANAANASSLLYWTLPDVNWAGFYFMKEGELVLGPFQGKPACVRISVGRGVCGTAVQQSQTVVINNVLEFPGHIACDAASRSEIVVPISKYHRVVGVLDVDSPTPARFDDDDRQGLEEFVRIFCEKTHLLSK